MKEPTRYAMCLSYAKDGGVNGAAMEPHSTGLYLEWPEYYELRKRYDALIAAINKHWTDVYGAAVVDHEADGKLYEVFEEMKK